MNFKKLYIIRGIIIIISILLIARYNFSEKAKQVRYKGTLCGSSNYTLYGKYQIADKRLLINPNDTSEYVEISLEKFIKTYDAVITSMYLEKDTFYCLISKGYSKEESIELIEIKDNIDNHTVIATFPSRKNTNNTLKTIKVGKKLFVLVDNVVYSIDMITKEVKIVYKDVGKISNIFPYSNGILMVQFINGDRSVSLLTETTNTPMNLKDKNIMGTFKNHNSLVINGDNSIYILDNNTLSEETILYSHLFRSYAILDDRAIVIALQPVKYSKVDMFYDFYYDGMDLLRDTHIKCLKPVIYDFETRNVTDFNTELRIEKYWEDVPFDKERLEKLAKERFGTY